MPARSAPDKKWSTQNAQHLANGRSELAQAIQSLTAMGVSDGSFKDQYGTAAWTIQAPNSMAHLTRVNIIPGAPNIQSAYKSELGGLYGIIVAVEALCEHYDIDSGSITIACDGESALHYAFDWENKWLLKTPHLDLILAIQTMLQTSKIQWQFRHVKGHQDDFVGPLDK